MTQIDIKIDGNSVINFNFDTNVLKLNSVLSDQLPIQTANTLCGTTNCYNCNEVQCNNVKCSDTKCTQIQCNSVHCSSVKCLETQCNEVKCTDCTYNYSDDCKDDGN